MTNNVVIKWLIKFTIKLSCLHTPPHVAQIKAGEKMDRRKNLWVVSVESPLSEKLLETRGSIRGIYPIGDDPNYAQTTGYLKMKPVRKINMSEQS